MKKQVKIDDFRELKNKVEGGGDICILQFQEMHKSDSSLFNIRDISYIHTDHNNDTCDIQTCFGQSINAISDSINIYEYYKGIL